MPTLCDVYELVSQGERLVGQRRALSDRPSTIPYNASGTLTCQSNPLTVKTIQYEVASAQTIPKSTDCSRDRKINQHPQPSLLIAIEADCPSPNPGTPPVALSACAPARFTPKFARLPAYARRAPGIVEIAVEAKRRSRTRSRRPAGGLVAGLSKLHIPG